MKKYLKQAGYKEAKDRDDLTDKEFHLENISFGRSDNTVQGNVRVDRVETYILFLKTLNGDGFANKLDGIVERALVDGVNVYDDFTADAEYQENGYRVTMTFTIRG